MTIYLVTATLSQPGRDYLALSHAIKSIANGWWHRMNDVWLINTHLDARAIRNHVVGSIDASDKLFVLRVGDDWASHNLPQDAADWLTQHMPQPLPMGGLGALNALAAPPFPMGLGGLGAFAGVQPSPLGSWLKS